MKPIIVTEEHKSKLLEMCKVLFPEYGRIEIQEYAIDVDKSLPSPVFVDLYKQHITIPFDIYSIHWFEFCITHLVEKLFNSFEEDDEDFYDRYINEGASFYGVGVNEVIFVMLSSKKHIIDYIYEEFKKLKK
jgi:hypothetical protein